jgi:hypothetical protein
VDGLKEAWEHEELPVCVLVREDYVGRETDWERDVRLVATAKTDRITVAEVDVVVGLERPVVVVLPTSHALSLCDKYPADTNEFNYNLFMWARCTTQIIIVDVDSNANPLETIERIYDLCHQYINEIANDSTNDYSPGKVRSLLLQLYDFFRKHCFPHGNEGIDARIPAGQFTDAVDKIKRSLSFVFNLPNSENEGRYEDEDVDEISKGIFELWQMMHRIGEQGDLTAGQVSLDSQSAASAFSFDEELSKAVDVVVRGMLHVLRNLEAPTDDTANESS